jgi:Fe-S-cluster containining protein
MDEPRDSHTGDLPAGVFGVWLEQMRAALRHEADADVPCGSCCACCSTSHFVHVGPDEREALAHIPRELLFPAPGMPAGHVVLGHDQRGRCPLLDDGGRCTVYEHRPLTCRTYDCRVFAAAGIDADREEITRRARRWRFAEAAPRDREAHAAVRVAARFVRDNAPAFPGGAVPDDPGQLAVLAVRVAGVFLPGGQAANGADPVTVAAAIVRASEESSR